MFCFVFFLKKEEDRGLSDHSTFHIKLPGCQSQCIRITQRGSCRCFGERDFNTTYKALYQCEGEHGILKLHRRNKQWMEKLWLRGEFVFILF